MQPYRPVQLNELNEDTVKAGFLYNFAQFATWPSGTMRTRRIVFCIEDSAIDRGVFAGWTTGSGNRPPLDLRFFDPPGEAGALKGCDVVFATATADRDVKALVAFAREANALLVSDATGFARRGGHIELFLDGNQFRFRLNLAELQRSGVRLSSRVLSLAEIVGEGGLQ